MLLHVVDELWAFRVGTSIDKSFSQSHKGPFASFHTLAGSIVHTTYNIFKGYRVVRFSEKNW